MPKKIKNIVVIGAPRSGTTLIGGIISNADKAFPMLPECTYATQLVRHYYDISNYSDPQRYSAYAISEDKLQNIYKTAVSEFISNAHSHFDGMSCEYLVLKDPELTLLADLIPTFFGDNCKCVCSVRDPRAVISSLIKVFRKKKAARKKLKEAFNWDSISKAFRIFFDEKQMLSKVYNYYFISHTSILYKTGGMHVVQYEKIVTHDENEFKRLEKYLGYEVNRNGFGKAHFGFDKQDPCYSESYGKKIQDIKSDFREMISRRGLKKIQRVFSGFNSIYNWW